MTIPAPIELSRDVTDCRYVSFLRDGKKPHVPVDIFFGGQEKCLPKYEINREGFPVFVLEYVHEGEALLSLEGRPETVRKDSLFWYGPGISCHLMNRGKSPLVKSFFAFHCHGGSPRDVYGLSRYFVGPNRGGERVREWVRLLLDEASSDHADSWKICCSLLDILLLHCLRSEEMERHSQDKAFDVFREIKAYISENHLRLRRMQDIAHGTGLGVSYISRLFRRYDHLTPYEYLQQRQMDYAFDLLRNENLQVQEAALKAGYEDPFHFSRLFKKYKGIPPSEVGR